MASPLRSMDPETLPDDILAAILTIAERKSGEERFRFKGTDFDLQRVFKDLSEEFPVVRDYFVFSSTGPFPYSPVLTDSISRLQLSGLIGRENPDFEFLFLKPSARQYFEQLISKRLSPKLLEQLDAVAQAFNSRVFA